MMFDGWVVTVEARRDTTYHTYEYHNPQIYRPPDGTNALKVMRMVDSLFRFTRPPQNLKHVRGIYLYGRDTSDFAPCKRPGQTGLVEGRLGPIEKLIGDSVWRARSGPTRAFEIEAWTRLRDKPLERYGRAFKRYWGIDSVTAVRAISGRVCGG
jgi:hypothetical protein